MKLKSVQDAGKWNIQIISIHTSYAKQKRRMPPEILTLGFMLLFVLLTMKTARRFEPDFESDSVGVIQTHGKKQPFHQSLYNLQSGVLLRPTSLQRFWDREAASTVTANLNIECFMNNFIETSASKGATRCWKFKQKKKHRGNYKVLICFNQGPSTNSRRNKR